MQIEASEAVQIEAGEAVQIEAQAFVPEHVNQDVSGTHLPATAWPRQMLAVMYATQCPLPESGRGDYDPPFAGSNGGNDEGRLLALMQGPSRNDGWWYRLGCRVPTYESEVRGREPPGTEMTEQVISQGQGLQEAVFLANRPGDNRRDYLFLFSCLQG